MNLGTSPKITFMLQYTEANSQYVDYTNRDEAVSLENDLSQEMSQQMIEGLTTEELVQIKENVPEMNLDFREYVDYMNRSYATEGQSETITAVFTQSSDYLQRKHLTTLKNQLKEAYENGSLLWQGVISFDNKFLAEQGLYDLATDQVDQKAIKAVMREMMPTLIKKEGLSDTAFWWGNIHLNTDNIHIHFGLSELQSNREKIFYEPRGRMEYKGNFSQKTIERFKSGFYHGLLKEETRSHLIRKEQVLANLKSSLIQSIYSDRQVVSAHEAFFLKQAYHYLPQNGKWRYGSNAKNFAVSKFFLDKYLDSYLQHSGKKLYDSFIKESREFLSEFQDVYSTEKNRVYEKLRQVDGRIERSLASSKGYELEHLLEKRVADLRERLGNAVLAGFRKSSPESTEAQLEKNIDSFSPSNQKKILEQLPEASLIRSAASWEKLGYSIKDESQAIEIIQPRYQAYDKYGNGFGKVEYLTSKVYDISQVLKKNSQGRMTLQELSLFSSDELSYLIDSIKKDSTMSNEQAGLGIYRYALKLNSLKERKSVLLVQQKLLGQIHASVEDQEFLVFKGNRIKEELKFIDLQLIPNYKLTEEERNQKQALRRQFENSVQMPIEKATAKGIQIPIRHLREELKLVSGIKDQGILSLLEGREITKSQYQEELQNQISIFQVKHQIHQRNKRIADATTPDLIKELKRENYYSFKQLEEMYAGLNNSDKQKDGVTKAVAKKVEHKMITKRNNLQQAKGKITIDSNFMNQVAASLNRAQMANKKALQERIRSDDRKEREEQEEAREAKR